MKICRNKKCIVIHPRNIRLYLAIRSMWMKKKIVTQMKTYLNYKIQEKNFFSNKVLPANVKFLVIFACHCDSERKLNTIKNNLKYFLFHTVDVVVINSKGLPYNAELETFCRPYRNVYYKETENSATLDYGKWVHILKNQPQLSSDFVVLTNDSFFMHENIHHFFHLAIKKNVQLFGYNDSVQERYHYQSYLFVLRNDAVPAFIKRFQQKETSIHTYNDVIVTYELKMTDWFPSKDVYLKIAGFTRGANIFFTSPQLYNKLKEKKLLPFTKLKAPVHISFPNNNTNMHTNTNNNYSNYNFNLSRHVTMVCARYNENLEWLVPVLSNCIIYNKGENDLHYLPPQAKVVRCENIGREGHTYVKHIIDNYENLSEIILFTQGNPVDHIHHLDERMSYRELYDVFSSGRTHAPFSYVSKHFIKVKNEECFDFCSGIPSLRIPLFSPIDKRTILDSLTSQKTFVAADNENAKEAIDVLITEIKKDIRHKSTIWMYELTELLEKNAFFMSTETGLQWRNALFKLFKINPKYEKKIKDYEFGYGAIFVVKKHQILKHSLKFWKNIEQCLQTNCPSAGYGLEKMWPIILNS